MKKYSVHCLDISCPERKSVCCGAESIATNRKDYMFACKNCGSEFFGRECENKKTQSKVKIIPDEGNGYFISVKDQWTENIIAITKEELKKIVLYGEIILKNEK